MFRKISNDIEKSAEKLSRPDQILGVMKIGVEYSAKQIAVELDLKGSRTRQLLKELVEQQKIECIGVTKNRKYIKR